jgi:phosphatidylglycerol:prolipoprotein diacylglycerol transferase
MYPDFQYLLQSLFGTEMPEWLSIFKTFGFLVALSFLAAAYTLIKELKRKEELGLLQPEFTSIEIGKPATANELVWAALLGFILGYKVGGIFGNAAEVAPNPMGYLFSLQGNVIAGIIGALIIGYSKYAEKKKQELPEVQTKRIATFPHQLVSELAILAAIGGFAGAKIFNAFETWDDFIKNPAESLLSSSGLTFYGGLIVATLVLYFYARKHKIPFAHLCDAAAPGLILAYGLGRLGCQFAGDGDWGIFNSAYATAPNGSLQLISPESYMHYVHNSGQYFVNNFGNFNTIPHLYSAAPNWLPRWMFAMNYPHNVNNEGIALANCVGHYCSVLPMGVFPTPLYESAACIVIFFVLWSMRKKLKRPLQMFGWYLIFNGIERFFVEKIRVNYKYDWGFIHPTQAEIISVGLIIVGIVILLTRKKEVTMA